MDDEAIKAMERRVLKKSLIINAGLIGLVAGAFAVLLLPSMEKSDDGERLSAIESHIEKVEAEQKTFGERAAEIKSQMDERISMEIASAQEATQTKLDALGNFSNAPLMGQLWARYQGMMGSPEGQKDVKQSLADLASAFSDMSPDSSMAEVLASVRMDSDALSSSLSDVPAQDMKAAAILLGMAQFRNALNRGSEPFENDYAVLKTLVGDDNPELIVALDKLAPHAQDGVLTPDGLSAELRGLVGDLVVASLSGEEVSVKERAAARFNQALQVKKDGELITGTPTQSALVRAENLLAAGDVKGAIAEVKLLEGSALKLAAPWIGQAEATMMARDVKRLLGGAMATHVNAVSPYSR